MQAFSQDLSKRPKLLSCLIPDMNGSYTAVVLCRLSATDLSGRTLWLSYHSISAIEIVLLSDAGCKPQISTRETIIFFLSQLSAIEIMLFPDAGCQPRYQL